MSRPKEWCGLCALGLAMVLLANYPSAGTVRASQAPNGRQPIKAEGPRRLAEILTESIDMKPFQDLGEISLKDAVELMYQRFQKLEKEVPILIDDEAFRAADHTTPDIYDTRVKFPAFPRTLTFDTVLRLIVSKYPKGNATYLVRSTHILITTTEQAAPQVQTIQGRFDATPLRWALEELSVQTGINIILDGRVGEKARTPITAEFKPQTNLMTATHLLADMADLKVVPINNTLYVTSRTNPVDFAPRIKGAKGTKKAPPPEK